MYGHSGTVSSLNHTFFLGKLESINMVNHHVNLYSVHILEGLEWGGGVGLVFTIH